MMSYAMASKLFIDMVSVRFRILLDRVANLGELYSRLALVDGYKH